ncbi:ECF transporter S component [Nonomuraea sp. NBC_01738]|uniref:ECF transporter S component n=1 Tax=Nonomuraea sp. NBC_01738 TaxID=2976003 RepID=UPI002E103179|nr:ECF transporter S component [Nonomuraea sp. NBC_01738]
MSTDAVPSRAPLWEISSRVVVFAAVGAALYAVLGIISIRIPGTQNVDIRPAFALVPFFGLRFGPIAGFFTGFVGNVIIDQIIGNGALTYWNWSVANGLTGLLAGLFGAAVLARAHKEAVRLVLVAVLSWLAMFVAFLSTITDMWLQGLTLGAWATLAFGALLLSNTLVTLILTPALDAIWEPISKRMGR